MSADHVTIVGLEVCKIVALCVGYFVTLLGGIKLGLDVTFWLLDLILVKLGYLSLVCDFINHREELHALRKQTNKQTNKQNENI